MAVDPVVGSSSIELGLAPALLGRLAAVAKGRLLVIDYYASWHRGLAVGDLTVRLGEPDAEPRYVELAAVEGVTVLAERGLLGILAGAILRETGPPFARHLAIVLARPERWIEFLEHRAVSRNPRR